MTVWVIVGKPDYPERLSISWAAVCLTPLAAKKHLVRFSVQEKMALTANPEWRKLTLNEKYAYLDEKGMLVGEIQKQEVLL